MSSNEFYQIFFDNFPIELQNKFRVIEFESCVQDIKHIYTFDNKKLNKIKFESQ
jgi:hypothetical protein